MMRTSYMALRNHTPEAVEATSTTLSRRATRTNVLIRANDRTIANDHKQDLTSNVRSNTILLTRRTQEANAERERVENVGRIQDREGQDVPAGGLGERARNLGQDRSLVPPLDVHAPGRAEGFDLDARLGRGEGDVRPLHRTAHGRAGDGRGRGRVTFVRQGWAANAAAHPTPFECVARSIVRSAGNTLPTTTTLPPCRPPKGDLTRAVVFV